MSTDGISKEQALRRFKTAAHNAKSMLALVFTQHEIVSRAHAFALEAGCTDEEILALADELAKAEASLLSAVTGWARALVEVKKAEELRRAKPPEEARDGR